MRGWSCFVLVFALIRKAAALDLLTPQRKEIESAPSTWIGSPTLTVTSNLSSASFGTLCDPVECSSDAVVIFARENRGCSSESKARNAQRGGCRAVVLSTDYPIPGGSLTGPIQFDGTSTADLENMLVVEVPIGDWEWVRTLSQNAQTQSPPARVAFTVRKSPEIVRANAWHRVWTSPLRFVFVNGPLALLQMAVLVFLARRLWSFLEAAADAADRPSASSRSASSSSSEWRAASRAPMPAAPRPAPARVVAVACGCARRSGKARARGPRCSSLPLLVLSTEAVASLIRCLYFLVDPIWTTNTLSRLPAQLLLTATVPLSFVETIMIIIFWRDTVQGRIITPDNRRARRRAFFVVLPAAVLAELCTSVPRGLFLNVIWTTYITVAFYVCAQVVIGLAFAVYGVRVLRKLARLSHRLSARREAKNRDRRSASDPLPSAPRAQRPRSGSMPAAGARAVAGAGTAGASIALPVIPERGPAPDTSRGSEAAGTDARSERSDPAAAAAAAAGAGAAGAATASSAGTDDGGGDHGGADSGLTDIWSAATPATSAPRPPAAAASVRYSFANPLQATARWASADAASDAGNDGGRRAAPLPRPAPPRRLRVIGQSARSFSRLMAGSLTRQERQVAFLTKMTRFVIAVSLCNAVSAITMALIGTPAVMGTPWSTMGLIETFYLVQISQSALAIYVFRPPKSAAGSLGAAHGSRLS